MLLFGYRRLDPFKDAHEDPFIDVPILPSLHTLEIRVYPDLCTAWTVLQWANSRILPQLRCLVLDNVPITLNAFMHDDTDLEAPPYAQITNLTVSLGLVDEAIKTFIFCPHLRTASVWVERIWDESSIPTETTMSELESLSIEAVRPLEIETLEVFFNALTLPALTCLKVASDGWPHDEFISLISRSHCTLTRLSLSGVYMPYGDIRDVFIHTPCLTHLSLDDWDSEVTSPFITDRVIRLLTWSPYGSDSDATVADRTNNVLPSLTHLELILCNAIDTPDAIVDLVRSRSWFLDTVTTGGLPQRLNEVVIDLWWAGEKKRPVYRQLEDMRKNRGISIIIL